MLFIFFEQRSKCAIERPHCRHARVTSRFLVPATFAVVRPLATLVSHSTYEGLAVKEDHCFNFGRQATTAHALRFLQAVINPAPVLSNNV